MKVSTLSEKTVFLFETLQDVLVLARQGRLGQANAVIKIAG